MKALFFILALPFLSACNKSEKTTVPNGGPLALETAAADFKSRVADLQAAKIENAVFADVRHDVSRTNSITSPLKGQVWAKKIVNRPSGPSTVWDVTINASFRDGRWHYDNCVGKVTTGLEMIEFEESSTAIQSAYDFIKALRLKHDDEIHYEQFK